MAHTLYPLTFEPNLVVTVWGGTRLVELYGKPRPDGPLGESWEVSAVPGRVSVVDAGPLAGRALDELVRVHGRALVGRAVAARHGDELPLLLKLLDASQDLSVQVHPDAAQAARLGGGARSKSEAWLILHVEPGAKLVVGVADGLDRARFEALVDSGRIEECLRWVEVRPGDVVPVDPGTLHAIGAGIVLLELQETSDTTYRFYDYGRLGLDGKPRQLHVEQAKEVIRLEAGRERATILPLEGPGRRELLHRGAAVELHRWAFDAPVTLPADPERFWLLTTLEGEVTLRSDSAVPEVTLARGRSALVPASLEVELAPAGAATLFLGAVPVDR